MATSPDIRTPRLLITAFSERYLSPRYVGWLNNPDVTRFSEQRHRTHTMESCRGYLESFESTPNYFWALLETGQGFLHIGNVNAYVNPIHETADVGILIGEMSVWGKGYAVETFEAVIRYLIEGLGLRKVTAGTLRANAQMVRVMEKAGMIEDGIRKRHYLWNGTETDMIHMAVFRDQWVGRRNEIP